MAQHVIRHIRVFLHCNLSQLMYVAYYILVAFCLIKISIIGFILYGLPMPQMVMAGHVIPAFRQIFAQFPVSFYIFHHAVANLQHAFYLTFRNPFHRVDLGLVSLEG